jgi:hypothetical protein
MCGRRNAFAVESVDAAVNRGKRDLLQRQKRPTFAIESVDAAVNRGKRDLLQRQKRPTFAIESVDAAVTPERLPWRDSVCERDQECARTDERE